MRYISYKKVLVFLIVFALNYAQIIPCFAAEKTPKAKVAFAGISYEDVPDEVRERMLARVQELLEQEPSFELTKPKDVEKKIGAERLAQFLAQPDSAAYRALAVELQADYVFAGRLANNSRDNRVLLVGTFERYDRAANILNKFEVLKHYDNIGIEMVKFREEFVKTIVPTGAGRSKKLPFIVFGGLTIAGIVALVLSSSRSGAEGSGGPPIGDPP